MCGSRAHGAWPVIARDLGETCSFALFQSLWLTLYSSFLRTQLSVFTPVPLGPSVSSCMWSSDPSCVSPQWNSTLVRGFFPIMALTTWDWSGPIPGVPPCRDVNSLQAELSPAVPESLFHIKSTKHICEVLIHVNERRNGGMHENIVKWGVYNDGLLLRLKTPLCVWCWPMWDFAIWMSDVIMRFYLGGTCCTFKVKCPLFFIQLELSNQVLIT